MFSTTLKSIVGMVAWGLGILLVLVATQSLVMSNYLACESSFSRLNWESKPVYLDELVGKFFGTFFPEATLSHLSALSLSFGIALLFFFFTNEAFRILESTRMRDLHRREGDEEQVSAFTHLIKQQCLITVLLAVPLYFLIRFDIYLYLFRGASSVLLEDPHDSVNLLPWSQLNQQPSFALNVTAVGAVAFAALTFGLCILLEGFSMKFRKYADRLLLSVDSLFESGEPAQQELLGYTAGEQPVFEPGVPLAYDNNGVPLEGESDVYSATPSPVGSTDVPDAADSHSKESSRNAEPLFVVPDLDAQPSASNVGAGGKPKTNQAPPQRDAKRRAPAPGPIPARPVPAAELREVIGSSDDAGNLERISMQAAVRDSRYFVDSAGQIWIRHFWEQLHGAQTTGGDDPSPSTEAEAA